MKNADQKLTIGMIPTRREAFSNPETIEQKQRAMQRFRELSESLDFKMIEIEDLNEEGMLKRYDEVPFVCDKMKTERVDALIFLHCNFGQEEAVGRIAKEMNVPVLVWGPRDAAPKGLEWRPTDSQCGMFATTKLLQRYHVKYSYIENCHLDSAILEQGLKDFLAVVSGVKAFRSLRIAKISTRPKEFLSVAVNENELLEKFDIEIVPGEATRICHMIDTILEKEKGRMEDLLNDIKAHDIDIEQLGEAKYKVAAIELALMDFAKMNQCNAIACECWSLFNQCYGVAPCFLFGDLNDRGIPCACENDIMAAIASVIAIGAARYLVPSFVADLTIRHPENDNAELLWHCGSFAKRLKSKVSKGYITPNGKGFYELEQGVYTVLRFDEIGGRYYLFTGEGKRIDGPVTNGNYLWYEVEDWVRWEKKFMYGPYIHHVVGIPGSYSSVMKEICRYLDITFDAPELPTFINE
jgi:L-fucose isomerase-like protein